MKSSIRFVTQDNQHQDVRAFEAFGQIVVREAPLILEI